MERGGSVKIRFPLSMGIESENHNKPANASRKPSGEVKWWAIMPTASAPFTLAALSSMNRQSFAVNPLRSSSNR